MANLISTTKIHKTIGESKNEKSENGKNEKLPKMAENMGLKLFECSSDFHHIKTFVISIKI